MEVFEPNMAKIVGPMIILLEDEKSPNFADQDLGERTFKNGGKSPFSRWGSRVNLAIAGEKLFLLNDL
jgi:hypothetical protein